MTEWDMDRESPDMDKTDLEGEFETVTITDDTGRTLDCYVEQTLEVDGAEYVLLLPVDSPVEIAVWQGEGDEEEALPIEEDAEIDRVFSVAKAVLGEQNLTLKRTAIVLTVEGELPEFEESDEEDEDEIDLPMLATFFVEDQEYEIYPVLDPFFILARLTESGEISLLSEEEIEKLEPLIRPMIEDQLFDEME